MVIQSSLRKGHTRGAGRKFTLEKQSHHMPQGSHMEGVIRERVQQSKLGRGQRERVGEKQRYLWTSAFIGVSGDVPKQKV